MQRVTIGRYAGLPLIGPLIESFGFAGWIEGVRDDGTTWVMYIDDTGSPTLYWPTRDEDGGVVGDPVILLG